MIRTVSRHELNQILRRVAALPEVAKFEVFEAVRADLVATLSDAEQRNCLVSDRADVIAAITKVAEHLKLAPGVAPTVAEFNRGARELGLDWNHSRVTRAYEKWNNATQAFLGRAPRETPSQRELRRRRGSRRRTPDGYFKGVREWLATCPQKETMTAYETWTEEANPSLAAGEVLHVRGHAIRTATALGWKNILAVAKDEKTFEDAGRDEVAALLPATSRHAIIGLNATAGLLGLSVQHAGALASGKRGRGFPTSVATIEGHRAWLVRDIRAYKRGAVVSARQEGEKQGLYMDAPELESRLGINHRTLWARIGDKRWDKIPQPEGFVSKKAAYWHRAKAEKWLADHAKAPGPGKA